MLSVLVLHCPNRGSLAFTACEQRVGDFVAAISQICRNLYWVSLTPFGVQ
jgi:hypothetical protein